MSYELALVLGVLIPLASFLVLAVWGARIGKPRASWVALAAIGASCLLSTYVLLGWHGLSESARADLTAGAYRHHWADFGGIPITVGVKLDSLTVIMYFMVTFIAFWIHFFSIGYMEGHSDEVDGVSKYHRFFAYLSLFCFSMLGLVVASSLLFLFIFWELVGLCSYLLIGFYFERKYASNAAMKAFITNRVGDFGFLIGMMLVVKYLGTFDLDAAARAFAVQCDAGTGIFASTYTLFGYSLATLMGIGLFCGAIGKSAQFPLHVWLPDAMAGPTPVSALIHAATMVAAGVYLVARVFRLLTPEAQMFVAVIGCITLTITALIAVVQTDIKKGLAYSTLSQLGYMIFGMGVGAWIGALFHLMTHAFFKAMLFLCSGQVIEGCHHEQDIRKMGGLRKKMPATCWTFFIGVLAIAGFGIPGAHFGLGGYFSKDEILAVAYERAFNWFDTTDAAGDEEHASAASDFRFVSYSDEDPAAGHAESSNRLDLARRQRDLPKVMFWLPIFIAYVTPFYMMRLWWLTFCGKPRDHHVHDHAHEDWKMYLPLVVLAVGTVVSSFFLFRPLIADAAATAADAAAVVAIDGQATHETVAPAMRTLTHAPGRDPHAKLVWIVGFSWLAGMGLAAFIYRNGLELGERLRRGFGFFHRFLEQKMYFDHVYDAVLVGGTVVVAHVAMLFDKLVIDGLANLSAYFTRVTAFFTGRQLDMPVERGDLGLVDAVVNGLANTTLDLGASLRRPQSGRIRTYITLAAGSVAVVLLLVLLSDQIAAGLRWLFPDGGPIAAAGGE